MLDYRFIKENLNAVKKNILQRNMSADADAVVALFNKRTELTTNVQNLQAKRNENAQAMKAKLDEAERNRLIAEGKRIKEAIAAAEAELAETEQKLETEARTIWRIRMLRSVP